MINIFVSVDYLKNKLTNVSGKLQTALNWFDISMINGGTSYYYKLIRIATLSLKLATLCLVLKVILWLKR